MSTKSKSATGTSETTAPVKKLSTVRHSEKELKKQAKAEYEAAQAKKLGKDQTATAEETPKPKKDKKAKLKQKNLESAEETIEDTKRESKYNYPDTCETDGQKKTFRRKARETKKALEKAIETLTASETKEDKAQLKEKQKEYAAFIEITYNEQPE